MISSEEHREACRVYMQKYRSKPENREKIRQQNAEYRKRKKLESIRQVSEIGSLETSIDMQSVRLKLMDNELREAKLKSELLEKECSVPGHYLTLIAQLQHQNDTKQQQLVAIASVIQPPESSDISAATYYQSIVQSIQSILSPDTIQYCTSASTSPILSSISISSTPSTSPQHSPINNNKRTKINNNNNVQSQQQQSPSSQQQYFSYQQQYSSMTNFSLSSSNGGTGYSSPPSSPSLQFPLSPRTSQPSPSTSSTSNVVVSQQLPRLCQSSPSTPTSSSTPSISPFQFRLVPDSPREIQPPQPLPTIMSSPNINLKASTSTITPPSSSSSSSTTTNPSNNLSLLCDVLQNEQYHTLPGGNTKTMSINQILC